MDSSQKPPWAQLDHVIALLYAFMVLILYSLTGILKVCKKILSLNILYNITI